MLTGIDPLRVYMAYELGGSRLELPPSSERAWAQVTPIHEKIAGWREPLSGARALSDLPVNARRYVDRLTSLAGVPVALLSVGAQRDQTIRLAVAYGWRRAHEHTETLDDERIKHQIVIGILSAPLRGTRLPSRATGRFATRHVKRRRG